MERWLRWLVIAAAVAAPVRDLQAEAVTLSFQLVAHPVEVHTIEVPGQPGRVVGIASFRGIAIFDDGRIAHHSYAGTFDFLNGAGAIHGYARWTFDDGSQLQSSYIGQTEPRPGGGITFAGSHDDVTGAGGYAGVKGQGSFEGRRLDPLGVGGDTYQRGTLELELPDG